MKMQTSGQRGKPPSRFRLWPLRRVLPRSLADRSGGVNMEYVILAVLIAAAVVVAVVVFSRSVASMFIVAGEGASTQHTKAKTELDKYRQDRDKDAKIAVEYHDSMHE
jgi:Flp pilus assembly pilin Flp